MDNETKIPCPGCQGLFEPHELVRYHDRHNIYSGRACSDHCARELPGQGDMWDYEAEEPIEEATSAPAPWAVEGLDSAEQADQERQIRKFSPPEEHHD